MHNYINMSLGVDVQTMNNNDIATITRLNSKGSENCQIYNNDKIQ